MKILLLLALALLASACGVLQELKEDPTKAIPKHYTETSPTDPNGRPGWFIPLSVSNKNNEDIGPFNRAK